MKQSKLLSLIILLFLCACSTEETTSYFNSGTPSTSGGTTTSSVTPISNFSFMTKHPITAVFVNTSTNANSYKWDFGDGQTSTEKSPTHKYKGIGVYKVQLTATASNGKMSTYAKNVTIEAPTKCYFAEVTFQKLSVNNKYIKFTLIDDDFFTTTWCSSAYVLISTANLPYLYSLSTPVYLNGMYEDDYYIINVYYNSTNSGTGTKLAGFKFYTSEVWAKGGYPSELNWAINNGNQISCKFIWK